VIIPNFTGVALHSEAILPLLLGIRMLFA